MLEKFIAYQMAKKFYWNCKALKISGVLQDQLLRASSSIAMNLSEGSGRRTPADKRRHYTIAFGSLQECRTILELERLEEPELMKLADELADELAAILYTMSRKTPKTNTPTEN